ncbi:MAG: hypothetical protein K1X68_08920 [Saprospiraceae bacterium]|nr:hypothetical protein [Saprospiraceae bacterium]HMW38359.1 hypothetical protein [Saprospiraceae bacterium]HMX87902.1 hypothetical protein [Saprospiraceae bacterium]HMZ39750.1 hypothetical protein [Saprospiraceae bacterium]HNA63378.1 hypothetical protein [Saprospiraceae bacterium]
MEQSFFSYKSTEEANSIRGQVISGIIHCLLFLALLFSAFEVKPPEDPDAPPYVSLVQFIPAPELKAYENAGGSKGAPGIETKEGGSQGESKATPTPSPVTETKVQDVPVEKIPPPSAPKPVVTSEPDVVTLPTPPKIPPVSKPTPTETPTTTSTPSTSVPSTPVKTSSGGSSGDDNTPGNGGNGTGSGSSQGSGDANTGNGSGAGGGAGTGGGGGTGGGAGSGSGAGTGEGAGVDFESTGPLRRLRESCEGVNKLAGPTVQEAVFNICIDRDGYIKYISYNSAKSRTRDFKFVRDAMSVAKSCKFKANPSAPKKECGTYTLRSSGVIQRIN